MTFLQKVRSYDLCSHVQLQTVVWRFWSSGFFLAEQPFRLCRYRTCFYCGCRYFCTCFLQHLLKVLCCCSGIDFCTFLTKVRSSLGDKTRLLPERYDGCLVPWCLYLRTIGCTDEHGTIRHLKLLPRINQTCGCLQIFF